MFVTEAFVIRMALFGCALVIFLLIELAASYRKATVSKFKRWLINLSLTAFNSLVLALIFGGAPLLLAAYVSEHNLGILNLPALASVPYWIKVLFTLVLLDFLLYVWHLLNHVVPFLWRFHRVHHTDLNMDVSTATRFHIGELSISAVIKLTLIYLLGADVLMVVIFESALVLCAQFEHSCLRISPRLEAVIWPVLVPPSMHRIHHSVKIKERNTNYGTIFSLWDRMLGTLLNDIDQQGIRIGVGGHFQEKKLNLHHLLVMPFTRYVP